MSRQSMSAAAVRGAYNHMAGVYDLLYGRVLHDGRLKLRRRMPLKTGDRVLEIGVGSGLMLPLYPRDVHVVGIDLSPGMLERARRRAARLALTHVELHVADAESSLLPEAGFDHVVLLYVYSVTPDPERLISESFRLCRPGGSIWIVNHFSGLGGWGLLERCARPFARWIGFRSDFPYSQYVESQGWDIQCVEEANLFGLSRVIQIRKA